MIAFLAKYVLYLMVLVFLLVWWRAENRSGKVELAGSAIFGLVLVLIFIVIASAVHDDPRPFVQNPSLHPLIAHAGDNGFPSDHSAAAGLIAMLVLLRHRWYGIILWVMALAIGWARVAAHVHHVQDIVAGLLMGALAAWLGSLAAAWVIRRLTDRHSTSPNKLTSLLVDDGAGSGRH